MIKHVLSFCLALAASGLPVRAQEQGLLTLTATPGLDLPFGRTAEFFSLGGGGGLWIDFILPRLPLLAIKAHASYEYLPFGEASAVSVVSVHGGFGLNLVLGRRLILMPYGTAGFYTGSILGDVEYSETNFALKAGAEIILLLNTFFGLGIDIHYRYSHAFYHGVGLSVGAHFALPLLSGGYPGLEKESDLPEYLRRLEQLQADAKALEMVSLRLQSVFPVFFKFYDTNSLGKVVVRNTTSEQLNNVRVDFLVDAYMAAPKRCASIAAIAPGDAMELDVYALFDEKRIMEITEATKAAARIQLEYAVGERTATQEFVETLRIHDRNALTWDDDRKVASFVTAKDPVILELSKNVASLVSIEGEAPFSRNLSLAVGLFCALQASGLSYAVDPTTPFAEYSESTDAVDFIQFPRQTLRYGAGDCDDLSILYSALLESLGIETAFVTTPGHIFTALSLQIDPDEARRTFGRTDELILRDGKTWLPVETTMLQDGFVAAWERGARQWREHEMREQAGFLRVHDSWVLYEPVGLPGTGENPVSLHAEKVAASFRAVMEKIVNRELYPQISAIEAKIGEGEDLPRYRNKLGVLYARYGLYTRAMEEFARVLEAEPYVPALLNMGSIHLLREDFVEALECYRQAEAQTPGNDKAILGMARAHHELQNYGLAEACYAELKAVNSELAAQYSYLSFGSEDSTRAADATSGRRRAVWDEGESSD